MMGFDPNSNYGKWLKAYPGNSGYHAEAEALFNQLSLEEQRDCYRAALAYRKSAAVHSGWQKSQAGFLRDHWWKSIVLEDKPEPKDWDQHNADVDARRAKMQADRESAREQWQRIPLSMREELLKNWEISDGEEEAGDRDHTGQAIPDGGIADTAIPIGSSDLRDRDGRQGQRTIGDLPLFDHR